MADLMKSVKTTIPSVKKGEILTGIVTKLTSSEILIDIGAKTEAVVLEKDRKILRSLLNELKVGDKVTVSILNPESDFGNPVVSLRRFIGNKLWEKIEEYQKSKKLLDVEVTQSSRGGFMVATNEGITGFLPNSQSQGGGLEGKKLKAAIIEVDRNDRKVIFSQKQVKSADFDKAQVFLKRDQKIDSIVSNIAPFGVFVTIPIADTIIEGFIKKDKIPPNMTFEVGNKIPTIVSEFDKKNQRVVLVPALKEKPIGYR